MKKSWLVAAILGLGLFLGTSGQASADSTCTAVNHEGGETFATAYYVGTVDGSTCTIGAAPNTNGITDNAVLGGPNNSNPVIYSFYFGGGTLSIEDLLGNQGTGTDVDLELDSLGATLSGSPTLACPAATCSIQLPYNNGNWGATGTINTGTLAAGYYALDTYFASSGTTDPQFELFVTDTPAVTTPEPGSVLLLGIGLLAIGLISTRRRALSF